MVSHCFSIHEGVGDVAVFDIFMSMCNAPNIIYHVRESAAAVVLRSHSHTANHAQIFTY